MEEVLKYIAAPLVDSLVQILGVGFQLVVDTFSECMAHGFEQDVP